MAGSQADASTAVARWRSGWESRYGRQAPKLESVDRTKLAKLAGRVSASDLLAGIDEYLADDWCKRMAHGLGYFCKRADEYIEKAKNRGGHGKADPKGIITEGDERHEADCARWRSEQSRRRD